MEVFLDTFPVFHQKHRDSHRWVGQDSIKTTPLVTAPHRAPPVLSKTSTPAHQANVTRTHAKAGVLHSWMGSGSVVNELGYEFYRTTY